MNSGATTVRVYDALKRNILGRAFRPGARLDPAVLADELASSVTPVRDALHLLVGEGLVATRIGDGFHLPQITEPELRDLYAWNAQVLQLAIRDWPPGTAAAPPIAVPQNHASTIANLFAHIAVGSRNGEHARAIASLNDRLAAARTLEAAVLRRDGDEVATLRGALDRVDARAVRAQVVTYHRRRVQAAAEIVRALYRAAAPGGDGDNNRSIEAV